MFRHGIIVFVGAAFLSCNSGPGSGTARITGVSVEAPASLPSSGTTSLRATVEGEGAFSPAVTWTVTGGGTFSDAHASPTIYTAPQVSAETTVTITATADGDSTKADSADLRITITLGAFEPRVDDTVIPDTPMVESPGGNLEPVSRSVDALGVPTDFVEGIVLVRPTSDAELTQFLERYQGTLLGDDTIPVPPPQLGVTLSDIERQATEYRVRINLTAIDGSNLESDGTAAGAEGALRFSSEAGMLTLAGVADAVAAGYDVSPEYLSTKTQSFPETMFSTQERPSGMTFIDAFATTRFQAGGSQSNVTLAWQFVATHGIVRRVSIATIDDGYWLNPNGTPRGTDSDLPANPAQYDFIGNDYFADGPNSGPCGPGNPCFWHGTGSIGVAAGILNNRLGDAGTGGAIADPILLKSSGVRSNINWAIRTAIAWGADVVSMSFGGNCNQACRIYDRDHTPFADAIAGGSRAAFVAAAGNGDAAGNGYEVGDPNFVHPCHEDHVICVGALNNDATTKIGYSNFGARVSIFAPTNIPVMSQPGANDNNPAGPAAPRSFGGTSASTPFVAGVAGMMKAINPDLTSDQVATILIETAHPGTAPVNRYIDALAAVRRAAEGRTPVRDRFDGGAGNGTTPTVLAAAASYTENNLSIHQTGDVDLITFTAPGRSTMTIDLQHAEALGRVYIESFETDGSCALPVPVSDATLGGTGHRYIYTTGGGRYTVRIRGDAINAYNLLITFAAAGIAPDTYESNDLFSTARHIFSLSPGGGFAFLIIEPRVTIEANIHAATDIDWYIVRGARINGGERFLLDAFAGVRLAGNEANMTLEVYRKNDDGTLGPLFAQRGGESCDPEAVTAPLEEDKYFYVRVAGGVGQYSLRNGVFGDVRKLPILVQPNIYDILHPGDPIEYIVRQPEWLVYVPDRRFDQLYLEGEGLSVDLFNFDGDLIRTAVADDLGVARLDIADTLPSEIYALQVTPDLGPTLVNFGWEESTAERTSENLILNPGAEDGAGSDTNDVVEDIPSWVSLADGNIQGSSSPPLPTVIYYNGYNGVPTADDPGPESRGEKLFAGGPYEQSAMQQGIVIDDAWQEAVQAGRVKATFRAYLGGTLDEGDYATAIVTFVDANLMELGRITLPPITALERVNETGLLPVSGAEDVPAATYGVIVTLGFTRQSFSYNDGYADNLSLILQEY